MDGHFVPEITFGPALVKCLRANLDKRVTPPAFFDMHMMVENPEKVRSESDVIANLNHYMAWPTLDVF